MAENEMTNTQRRRSGRAAVLLLALVVWSVPVLSQQPAASGDVAASAAEQEPTRLTVRLDAGRSDNILRASGNREDGTYRGPGLTFDFSRDAPLLAAAVDGDLEHRDYDVPGIESELYGTLDASIELRAVPDRFSWFFGNDYGQTRSDPFRIDSPINREYINVASTGPRLRVPLGGRAQLLLNGTSSTRSFQDSSVLDSDATSVEIGFARALSRRSEFRLTASKRRTDYALLPQSDNHVDDIYAAYQSRLATGSASLAVGTSRLESSGSVNSTPYVDLQWQRDVGARSRLDLSAGNRFIDVGQYFSTANVESVDLERLASVLLSAEVYRRSSAGLIYTMQFPRTRVRVDSRWGRDIYDRDRTLNNDLRQLGVELRRVVSPQLDAAIAAYAVDRRFAESAQHDKDTSVRLSLAKRFAGRFSVQFAYQRDGRHSAGGESFDENTVRVSFVCDLMPERRRLTDGLR